METNKQELLEDITEAELALVRAKKAELEAKLILAERRAERIKAGERRDKILATLTDEESRTPLFDRPETADERQRGPTAAEPEPTAPKPKRKRGKAEPAPASDPTKEWAALQLIVAHSITRDDPAWDEFLDLGWIGDADLLDTLREIWPANPARHVTADGEYIVRGGDDPALWYPVTKHWVDLVRPNLEGRALCEAVRHALDLAEAEPEPAAMKGGTQ